jgi:hypothetical protein
VAATPNLVASAAVFGIGAVDTQSPEVQREEKYASGWFNVSSGGNSMGAVVSYPSRGNGDKGVGCLARVRAKGGGGGAWAMCDVAGRRWGSGIGSKAGAEEAGGNRCTAVGDQNGVADR